MSPVVITAAEYRERIARGKKRAPHGRGIAVAGWREIGGIRHYYRSKAEMRNRLKLEARDAVIRRQTDLLDRAAEALSERHAELRAAIRAELKSEET